MFVALEMGGYEVCAPFELKVVGGMSSLQALQKQKGVEASAGLCGFQSESSSVDGCSSNSSSSGRSGYSYVDILEYKVEMVPM